MDDIQNWRYEQEQEFQRFGSAANDAGDQARNQQTFNLWRFSGRAQ
ncbi:hypothetical protein L342_3104 [Escherichia coli CE516]|nr:hypothetical protein L342_3104 [Escherichia coli CE516]